MANITYTVTESAIKPGKPLTTLTVFATYRATLRKRGKDFVVDCGDSGPIAREHTTRQFHSSQHLEDECYRIAKCHATATSPALSWDIIRGANTVREAIKRLTKEM